MLCGCARVQTYSLFSRVRTQIFMVPKCLEEMGNTDASVSLDGKILTLTYIARPNVQPMQYANR